MSPSTGNIEKSASVAKKSRGRPVTHATPLLVRLHPADLAALDAWIAAQPAPLSRQDAIRAMIRPSAPLR
jgi:hypothetical protein